MIDAKDMTANGFLETLVSGMKKVDEVTDIFKSFKPIPDENGMIQIPIDVEILHDISCLFSKTAIILAYLGTSHELAGSDK